MVIRRAINLVNVKGPSEGTTGEKLILYFIYECECECECKE